MKKDMEYKKQQKLNTLLSELPDYVNSYIDYGIGTLNRSYNTLIEYTYEIRKFFQFLIKRNPLVSNYSDITIDVLDQLDPLDMQEYMSYLRLYHKNENEIAHNEAAARKRSLSCLRSFFQYLFVYKELSQNVAKLIDAPKVNKKKKPRLTDDKVTDLIDNTEECVGPKSSEKYRLRSRFRDYAIMITLLYTGIRVSELCNLDIDDINWDTMTIIVTRKGGRQDEVMINEEVRDALAQYITMERETLDANNRALFLASRRGSDDRLSARSVERVISKYGLTVGECITPHTLRRTFGTKLYNQTGDPYLTATALGHKSVQTTAEYYASIEEKRMELIRNVNYDNKDQSN